MFIVNQNPYPLLSFPQRIYCAAQEAMRITQVTDIIAAMSCLSAISTAVSPNADWKHPATGQVRPCVLNQALVAISGDRKTTADLLVCRPFYEHDAAVILRHEADTKAYAKAKLRWAAIKKGLLSRVSKLAIAGKPTHEADAALDAHEALEPTRPIKHRIIHTNMTHVAMFEALEGDGKAIAMLTDEGQALLESTAMRHYGFLNSAWDGKPLLTYDRANHNSIIAQNARPTISFMIQPDPLAQFFAKRGKIVQSSGFCARYLFARSPSIQGLRQPSLDSPLIDLIPFHGRISELLTAYGQMIKTGNIARDVLEFDDNAKVRWLQIASNVEANFLPGNYLHDISDFGNKYMDIVGRIACLLWYFEANTVDLPQDAAARTDRIGKISVDTLNRAGVIADWHLHEYKQLFSPSLQRTSEEFDADSVYSYLYRNYYVHNVAEVSKNYVRQHCGVRGHGRFDNALRRLRGTQAIGTKLERLGTGKKETEIIMLNCQYFGSHPIY